MKISETLRAIAAHITPFNTQYQAALTARVNWSGTFLYMDGKTGMHCNDEAFYDHEHKIIHFLLMADIAESEGK